MEKLPYFFIGLTILIFVLLMIYNTKDKIIKLIYKKPDDRCKHNVHVFTKHKSISGFTTISYGIDKCENCGRIEETRQFASSESDPYTVLIKKGKFD